MRSEKLRRILGELQEELTHRTDIDGKGREILEQLSGDIQDLLVQLDDSRPLSEEHAINGRLREAIGHFEVSHPDFSAALCRVMDALAGMGF